MKNETNIIRKRQLRFLLMLSAMGLLLLSSCRRSSVSISESTGSAEVSAAGAVPGTDESEAADQRQKTAAVKTELWYVQISGAVVKPGVYEMAPDSRIFQLIEAAGGLTETAAVEQINQALRLQDGQHIHVPTIGETAKQTADGDNAAATDGAVTTSGRVNINRAGTEELCTLPGIGLSKAADIISYRTKLGGFTDPAQLMEIAGIKERLFEKIKDHIVIQ
ncbi:MAG: helix-hairpin-helix domain-containing protein [Lachnospiraceae bacterium]|nr:helix-hairpin-helix domain-containing protein [Lachnospiraceae bacterium]MDY5741488.1 helix-hairpin-helix domain-containing protein [Lachnospiraceae bacterium]